MYKYANCQNKYKSWTMLAVSREITQSGRGRRPNPTRRRYVTWKRKIVYKDNINRTRKGSGD